MLAFKYNSRQCLTLCGFCFVYDENKLHGTRSGLVCLHLLMVLPYSYHGNEGVCEVDYVYCQTLQRKFSAGNWMISCNPRTLLVENLFLQPLLLTDEGMHTTICQTVENFSRQLSTSDTPLWSCDMATELAHPPWKYSLNGLYISFSGCFMGLNNQVMVCKF